MTNTIILEDFKKILNHHKTYLMRRLISKQISLKKRTGVFGLLLLIGTFISACHKEDEKGYVMDAKQFAISVKQERLYQNEILARLEKGQGNPALADLVNKRRLSSTAYNNDLASFDFLNHTDSFNLSQKHVVNLENADKKMGEEHLRTLLSMLIDSDQTLIGLHVKASSNQGVQDERLRVWAREKMSSLQNNLDEVQKIKL
ncbi:MAG: hypothetical protein EOO95_11800 [Pedobacter sp.]|nr:MAG: hypothetical protein EOO95_11800 [Pedobacter sp.]